MNILDIAIIVFIVLEILNVLILYFKPDFKYGNGVSVFKEWEKGKEEELSHLFHMYMANWVAGSKLVFIALLIVVLFAGTNEIKVYAIIAAIISIATYFIKLHPIIKKLDEKDMLSKKGYSKTLFYMICGFLIMFSSALIIHIMI